MELKKGMYVRFKDKRGIQYIRKITSVNTEEPERRYAAIYIDKDANNCNGVSLKNIIGEPSFNLINLIEVGDYVNGEKVTSAEPVDEKDTERYLGFGDYDYYIHTSEDIKSVVTKEQFNACKYVVERNGNNEY